MATPLRKNKMESLGLLILRVTASIMIIQHGYGKLISLLNRNSAGFPEIFGMNSSLSMSLAMCAEFFCGILVLVGFCTRFAALPIVATMAVAVSQAHGFAIFGSGELAMMYLIIFVTIALAGAGSYSVDEIIYQRK